MIHIKKEVKKLLKAKPLERYTQSCLETCRDLYSSSITDLKNSVEAIKAGGYEDAKTWMSSAVDAPGTCEDGFQDGGIRSPIAEENDELFQLTVIALAITSLLG
ncbi:putative invertase inhibitor [Typha latifolia]|uniref:putative invertase inhibitor n=1 Tax=Typha latifolia TaxID=4733 RepID=UPI003C2D7512